MPTWADSIRMALAGWRIRMGERVRDWWATSGALHDPRPGDVWRSGDWTTEVHIIRATTLRLAPAYVVTIHRGSEVQGGTLDLPTLRDLLAGYRLARRGEG